MPAAASRTSPELREALDAKRAVEAAWEYFHALFKTVPASGVSLEEVELSPDGKYWLVTLSFEEPRRKSLELPDFLRVPRQKLKVFRVERRGGRVVSMKIPPGG